MQKLKFVGSKDFLLGAIYIAFGLVYGLNTWFQLPIGTAVEMGPGYFPIVLSGLLGLLGLNLVIRSTSGLLDEGFGPFPWRGFITISLATILFAVLIRGAGLGIATLVTVLVSSYGSRHVTWRSAVVTAVILTVFCTIVFIYGVRLPIGIFGTWFR